MIPKNLKYRDPNHLEHIRGLGCLVCGKRSVPHHLIQGGFGSDLLTVPLCPFKHHTEIHAYGIPKFQDKYGVNVWKECALILERIISTPNEEGHWGLCPSSENGDFKNGFN